MLNSKEIGPDWKMGAVLFNRPHRKDQQCLWRACWELDTLGWTELPDSCFTYSSTGRALLETRHVTAQMRPELYAPPAGAVGVFGYQGIPGRCPIGGRCQMCQVLQRQVSRDKLNKLVVPTVPIDDEDPSKTANHQ